MHVDRRPKDSMKSTWRADKSQWGLIHWIIEILNVHHVNLSQEVPVHQKTDPVPWMTQSSTHRWILVHAAWPMILQYLIQQYMGKPFHPMAAFTFYTICMQLNSIHHIWILRRLGHRYGFMDGDKHQRDGVPDNAMWKVFNSLELTTTVRPMIVTICAYQASMKPTLTLTWWLPLELSLYSVILDGFFYLYHRSCHELDSLWQYHRTHHLTKHPTPLLSSYADSEQEFIELALVPFLAWATIKYAFGLPMTFHDWWICHEYIIFSEAFGHSGVRIYAYSASPISWFLKMIDCELQIEDHDLHHRKGWRKSMNYGKQTRVWDRIFGTAGPRVEATEENMDVTRKFHMPLF